MSNTPAQEPALTPEELDAARKHCERRASEIEAQTAKHGSGWWPEGVAHAAALRTLLAARTVPPAAAPGGELREDKLASAARTAERSLNARACSAALAAAPGAGDRETAGMEPAWTQPETWRDAAGAISFEGSWQHDGFQRGAKWAVDQWRLSGCATPPSGGGDHAGGEATSAEDHRAQLEKIIHHAMSSATLRGIALDELKARKPSVDGNYQLLYLSNAVDAVLELDAARATAAPASDDLHYTGCPWKDGGSCDCHEGEPLAASPKAQGADVGLREALELSDPGKRIERPRHNLDAVHELIRTYLAASRTGQTGVGE